MRQRRKRAVLAHLKIESLVRDHKYWRMTMKSGEPNGWLDFIISIAWHIPLSSSFGIFLEWGPFAVSAFMVAICIAAMRGDLRAAAQFGEGPGGISGIAWIGILFYGFCCIRALL